MDVFLVFAAVVFALVAIGGWATAAIALHALAKFSIASGRFDVDATNRAWNLSRAVDAAVNQRVGVARVMRYGDPTTSGAPLGDAGAQQRGRVDEVHEYEREANRLHDDEAPDVRERFNEQPEVVEG